MSKLDDILYRVSPISSDKWRNENKEQIKSWILEEIENFTLIEDIPNQHSPAEYIGDVSGLRERIGES